MSDPGANNAPLLHLVAPEWGGVGIHRTFAHRMPSLALLTLGALARRSGWRVRLIDANYESLPDDRPDLVGVAVWTATAPSAYAIADTYRSRGVRVVLGGVHASVLPGEALRHADAVVVGEAESIFARVLDDALADRLEGMYHGEWLEISATPRAHEWSDLACDVPYWRYLPRATLQTTRGCRFNCDYCSVIRINGRGSRHRDAAAVAEEFAVLDRTAQRFGSMRWAALVDDDLAADLNYTKEFAEALVRSGNRVRFSVQASIGLAQDEEAVTLLARAGCRAVFTGLESASRTALIEANKKNRPHTFAQAIEALHRHGILIEGGFIFGFDADDAGVFARTAQFADEIGVDSAHFSILTPLPGTHTFARLSEASRVRTYDWGRYDLYHSVFDPALMDGQTLEAGLWSAYADFYRSRRRSRRIVRQLRQPIDRAVVAGVALTNWNYARRYRPVAAERTASYIADPIDLAALRVTSAAPAERALETAVFLRRPGTTA